MRSANTSSRLFRYLAGEKWMYIAGSAALVATNITRAGIPYLTKKSFDALEASEAGLAGGLSDEATARAVSFFALGIVGLAVLGAALRVISRLTIFNGGRRIEYRVRNDVYAHLQKLGPAWFGRMPVGDLLSRTINDITAVRLLGGPGLLNLVNTVAVYVTCIVPMLLISPSLTVWALSPLLLVFAATRFVGRGIYNASFAAQQALSQVSALASETINGIHVVQAYAKEGERDRGFAEASEGYRATYLRFVLLRAVMLPMLAGMGGLGIVTILYFGGRSVIGGALTLGDFVAMMGYLAFLMWPTVALGWMVSLWQRGRSAMDRVGEILDAEPEVHSPPPPGPGEPPLPTDVHGALSIRGLDFAYRRPDGAEVPVLHDVHLEVAPGESVVIVGPSGAGKSSLVSLIPHLAALPRDTVLIDGRDINDFPLDVLRRRVAFVPQEPFLFSMTAEANVAFGADDASRAQVERAAKLAALTGDIQRFPQGWDTLVGERGVTLSGGQRQRMTIARAAVLEPAIWIFDDCLSSVDATTEQQILRNLRTMTKGATALFVTHRLLGFESVDRIVVLQEGRITEQGSHEQLLAAGGWYARLYRKQRVETELLEAS